jgi:Adenylate and Guanylate cyclase catalytic domain
MLKFDSLKNNLHLLSGSSHFFLLPRTHIRTNTVEVEETENWAEYNSNFLRPDEEPNEPMSDIYYPLISDRNNLDKNGNPKVDAIISTQIYWREIVKAILPSDRDVIDVVFTNPCNPSFTYRVTGSWVKYIGRGDLHETRYDHLVQTSTLQRLDQYLVKTKYFGVPLDNQYFPFTVHLYPTQQMANFYLTKHPIMFTISALSILLFTSIVFITYDCNVERRQAVVMNTAVKTSHIVSALYPAEVRDQILEDANKDIEGDENQRKTTATTFKNVGLDRSDSNGIMGKGGAMGSSVRGNITDNPSNPIAHVYPDTTILFADLAGFTSWSARHEPTDVFTLLEALFGRMDEIARRKNVFKVATIGDCYLAATGLPKPSRRHAVSMCRFAYESLEAMSLVINQLDSVLGPDTADLKLRIGIHSGPTTAGVLRGDKSRFELFGDTVNTGTYYYLSCFRFQLLHSRN